MTVLTVVVSARLEVALLDIVVVFGHVFVLDVVRVAIAEMHLGHEVVLAALVTVVYVLLV